LTVWLVNGRYFACETKREGEKPTTDQQWRIDRINSRGGLAFVARCAEDVSAALQRRITDRGIDHEQESTGPAAQRVPVTHGRTRILRPAPRTARTIRAFAEATGFSYGTARQWKCGLQHSSRHALRTIKLLLNQAPAV